MTLTQFPQTWIHRSSPSGGWDERYNRVGGGKSNSGDSELAVMGKEGGKKNKRGSLIDWSELTSCKRQGPQTVSANVQAPNCFRGGLIAAHFVDGGAIKYMSGACYRKLAFSKLKTPLSFLCLECNRHTTSSMLIAQQGIERSVLDTL